VIHYRYDFRFENFRARDARVTIYYSRRRQQKNRKNRRGNYDFYELLHTPIMRNDAIFILGVKRIKISRQKQGGSEESEPPH
jgi:hypothetical protein